MALNEQKETWTCHLPLASAMLGRTGDACHHATFMTLLPTVCRAGPSKGHA